MGADIHAIITIHFEISNCLVLMRYIQLGYLAGVHFASHPAGIRRSLIECKVAGQADNKTSSSIDINHAYALSTFHHDGGL
jgi:hypothetical protein